MDSLNNEKFNNFTREFHEFYKRLDPNGKEFFERLSNAMAKDQTGAIRSAFGRTGSEINAIIARRDLPALARWLRRNTITCVK